MKNKTQAFQCFYLYICCLIGLLFLNNNNYCFAQNTNTHPPIISYVDTSSLPKIPITAKQNQALPFSKSTQKVNVTSHFINYGTNEGLALSSVSCGFTDSKGFLWFGTYGAGISRFDGKTFTTFDQRHGLSDVIIRTMYEDNFSNIWFATNKNLCVYNGHSIKPILKLANRYVSHLATKNKNSFWMAFSNSSIGIYTTSPEINTKDSTCIQIIKLPSKYKKFKIAHIFQDSRNNLWLGTDNNGVLFYSGGTNFSDTSKYINYSPKQLGGSFVQSITEDALGNIWIGTMTSLCRWDGKTIKKINALNRQKETPTTSLKSDSKGDLWIGTTRGVAFCKKKYLSDNAPIFENYTTENGLSDNFILKITEDSLQNLWFCTYAGGVCCYKRGSSKSIQLMHNSVLANARTLNESKKSETVWFGGYDNFLSSYDGKTVTNYHNTTLKTDNTIWCIIESENGEVLFGTNTDGIWVYKNNDFYQPLTAKDVGFSIRTLFLDKNQNLWIGTKGNGVLYYNYATKKSFLKKLDASCGFTNEMVWDIKQDSDGNMWFGTDDGLFCFNGRNLKKYATQQGLCDNRIFTITEDGAGNLWCATPNGVSCINKKQKNTPLFYNYTTNNGLADNVCYGIVIATTKKNEKQNTKSLVIGTNKGFSVLTGWKHKNGQIYPFGDKNIVFTNQIFKDYTSIWENYNNETGYPIKDLNTKAMCVAQKNYFSASLENTNTESFVFGSCGDNKIVQLNLSQINRSTLKPNLFLTQIKVNNQSVAWYQLFAHHNPKTAYDSLASINDEVLTFGKPLTDTAKTSMIKEFGTINFTELSKWYAIPQQLVLPYQHNNITIDFTAVETDRNFLVRYQYILEGYDKDWSPLSNKTFVTYGNIAEGSYVFKLKACTANGVWSDTLVYSFTVLPPWYRTWWMYLVYVIVAILFVILIVKWNARKLISQKKQLEQEVKKATKQIREEKEKVEHANLLVWEQKKVVEEKNKDILDSIHYAKRIQDAMLKVEEHRSEHLPAHFVLFMPKDIVSGDFYWAYEKDPYWYVAAVDCTGHGVPGAFMSLLGMSFLNDILSETEAPSPAQVLDLLRDKIIKELRQSGESGGNKDGMDISIIRLCLKTRELQWAGANNPLLIIENKQLIEIKPDKQPIGYYPDAKPFTNHTMQLTGNQYLYVLSDGYPDQFGGPEGKKFKMKQLKDILLDIHSLPMNEQKEHLKNVFLNWKGNLEQIDDVCVIGLKIE